MTALLTVLALTLGGDSLVTEVVFLDGMTQERALALWERVLGPAPGALVIPGRSPDVVVVKDAPARLQRFRALIDQLAGGVAAERIYVRPVVHMLPSELAALLGDVLAGGGAPDVVLVPDDRSGRLVVKATPARYKALDRLAKRLDVPPRGGARRTIGVEPAPDPPYEGVLPR